MGTDPGFLEKTEVALTGEYDVDGRVDEKTGITYIGRAARMPDGTWRCLANVGGALCLVEVSLREV